MARPKKPADKIRATIIRLRVTLSEKEQLDALAKNEGLSISDWVRGKAIGVKPLLQKPGPDRELLLRYLAAYGKIGSNINQIARQLNRKNDTEEFELPLNLITYALEEIRAVTQQLKATLDVSY